MKEMNGKRGRSTRRGYIIETEKGSFEPLVFLTTGGTGPSCTKVVKRIAGKIAAKRGELYSHVMGFVRTRLRFALLRSVLIAVRGVRGKTIREPNVGHVAFNLIPYSEPYDC